MLRDNEPYLSVNWLERLHAIRSEQIAALRGVFQRKFQSVGAAAKFAVMQVDGTIDAVRNGCSCTLTIDHQPEADDESHSGIFGIGDNGDLIAELILEAIVETHRARA